MTVITHVFTCICSKLSRLGASHAFSVGALSFPRGEESRRSRSRTRTRGRSRSRGRSRGRSRSRSKSRSRNTRRVGGREEAPASRRRTQLF